MASELETKRGTGQNSGGEPYASTVSIVHQHSMGVSTKEKIFLPFLFLGLGVLLVAGGMVVRDHMNKGYTKVSSMAGIVAMGNNPPAEVTGIAALVNPDDSRYAQVEVRGWQFWSGKSAIVHDHYIRIPGLKDESIEDLVKGGRGGATTLSFLMDLGSHDGYQYHIDLITRGGMETEETNLAIEVYPLSVTSPPAVSSGGLKDTYMESHGFDYKRDATFRDVAGFTTVGLLEKNGEAFRVQSQGYNVVLSGDLDPGIQALLLDMAGKKVTENMTFYLNLEKTSPWTEGGKPGRRQTAGEIGVARLDGIKLGKVYIANS